MGYHFLLQEEDTFQPLGLYPLHQMPPGVASCVSGGVQGETGLRKWKTLLLKVWVGSQEGIYIFCQLGSSFQSSLADLDDQLLGLGFVGQDNHSVHIQPMNSVVSCLATA